ncbi:MAG: GDSL-type esterase/lipase family protein [Acutalibacteraceae bacterium]|nr:GDSL-type esterase/lipase family protein [Acutalibacteraceae bacterium]
MFKKILSVLLTILMVISAMTGTAFALNDDVDIPVSKTEKTVINNAVFVNSSGQTIDSADENAVVYTGEVSSDGKVTAHCDFDTVSGAYEFVGWYCAGSKITDTADFTFIDGSYETLTPKIKSLNVLSDASSFESLAEGSVKVAIANSQDLYMYNSNKGTYSPVTTGPAPTGHTWGMFTNFTYPTHKKVGENYVEIEGATKKGAYNGDNIFQIKAIKGAYTHTYFPDYKTDSTATATVTVKPHSGNVMIGTGQMYRTAIKELTGLKPYTDYRLSFWVYQASDCGVLYSVAVADNYDGLQTNGNVAFLDDSNVLGYNVIAESDRVYGQWTQVTVNFSTLDKDTAYLHLSQNGLTTDGNKGMIFLDDLTVVEEENNAIKGRDLIEQDLANTQSVVKVSGNDLLLNYTASGIEFKANCEGTVKATFTSQVYNAAWDLRFALYVDGERQKDIILTGGKQEVVLGAALARGNHTFKIARMTETQIGTVNLNNISLNGEFKTPPEKKENFIDFYGDSITAGWGTTPYTGNPTNAYAYQDGTVTYAALTAAKLNANFNAFGYSGIGISVSGAADGKGITMTDRYPDLPKNKDADYVVVNLGTNDADKYVRLGLTEQQVKDAFYNFAKLIRTDYGKDSTIIFAYGMMTEGANGFVSYAVEKMIADGDENIYSVELPKGRNGGGGHPNMEQHAAAAEVLTAFIEDISFTVAGDIDGDGDCDNTDLVTLSQYVAGWDVLVDKRTIDANNDGSVDLKDVSLLAKYISGWDNIVVKGDIFGNYNPATRTLKEIEQKLKLNSRAAFVDNKLQMEWSYSGFEIQGYFKGDITLKDVTVLRSSYNGEVLCYAVLDGDTDNANQLRIKAGNNVILKDVEAGFHTVQFIKATEASAGIINVGEISYNGVIGDAPAQKELKIQVIGDSITSASSLYPANSTVDKILTNDITKGYAVKVANHYDADLSVVSMSGGTICSSSPSMQDYYKRTFFSKTDEYDFQRETQPDLVIIALGTNDTPKYLTNGVANENIGILKQGITNMLTLVRVKNPNAKILWVYGMMDVRISNVYKETVETFNETDGNTYYTMINRNDCTGEAGHPTPTGHTKNAQEYINFIDNNILTD